MHLLLSLVFLSFLTFPTLSFAQDTNTSYESIKPVNSSNTANLNSIFQRKQEASVEAKREASKQAVEKKRELLKTRLEKFKDKKKAELTEKINKDLNLINEKHTKAMSVYLERVGNLLEKLEERVAAAKTNGKDTAEAEKAIKEATDSISAAGEAVAAQAGKDYTLTVTDETKVKVEAKNMRDKLHTDLQATRKIVIQAKQALSNAIRVSAQSLGGKNED